MSVRNALHLDSLAGKFSSHCTRQEIETFFQLFKKFDTDSSGTIDANEVGAILRQAGEQATEAAVQKCIREVDADKSGNLSFEEFLTAVVKLRDTSTLSKATKKIHNIVGSSANIQHSISEDEKESFTQHINDRLQNDKDLEKRLPIPLEGFQLFQECKDGILLSKLINDSVPGTIDERALNMKGKLSAFQIAENNNVVINSAKAMGCSVVNIGSQDLVEGKEHLILGLIWQIIRIGLNAKVDIRIHPELFRLLEAGETLDDLLKLSTETILLRWINYHLKKANFDRRASNFSSDIKDSEIYTVLLNQLDSGQCDKSPLNERDLVKRAEMVLINAEKLGCRKYVNAKTICNGNAKLNFAFVANLFNTHPCLEALTAQEKAALDDWLFNSKGDREARAFSLWLNSLGVQPFVNSLYDDLRDGLVLLQAFDAIHPGLVEWKKVNKTPTIRFKKAENCNYAVVLGKGLNFSLVGIQGADIMDGNKTLTLGLVWQMMRDHIIHTLKKLSTGGQDIKDDDIVRWANETVKRGGKTTQISNFKDSQIRTGRFLIDLCNGIKKDIVDYSLVTDGKTDDEATMNAKYAISIARKLGGTIFVLPEDILEVKPKMVMTFVGTLMAVDRGINRG